MPLKNDMEERAISLAGMVALGLLLVAVGYYIFFPYTADTTYSTLSFAAYPTFHDDENILRLAIDLRNHSQSSASYSLVITSNDRFLGNQSLSLNVDETRVIPLEYPIQFTLEPDNWVQVVVNPDYGDGDTKRKPLELLGWFR
ncbi:MAG: hypothetical protein Q8P05_02235 [Candidatus Diapherotrites archaeon]|nr:hypothetical protein [Candidatus Diapherotrites archaeon]MDZ4256877.1 hypothetical protein [archaeon]